MKLAAVVGMTGAGKSEVSRLFEKSGFIRIRFGDVTDEEVRKRGLELNEENERSTRELLRQKYGMAAYAVLNLSRIDLALKQQDVIVDGLYSWEEYNFLQNYFGDRFSVVAVWASPRTRYARLAERADRRLTPEEAAGRDKAEVENINKAGPIAMADFTILNGSSLKELEKKTRAVIAAIKGKV
jgi:dephospho-CoA kinase